MSQTKLPPRPVNHILDIIGSLKIESNELDKVPVLYEVASRQFSKNQLWRIKELPKERYIILYMLSTGDVMDLSLRFHHMTASHKIGSSIFELKELEALYGIDPKVDTYKTFQEKVKPFVIVEKVNTNTFDGTIVKDSDESKRLIYKIPYDQFRQHFFTIGNANPVSKLA